VDAVDGTDLDAGAVLGADAGPRDHLGSALASHLPRDWRGFRFSMEAMWPQVSRLNLLELVPALQIPVFFLIGRNDYFVPPETSVAYFDALTAPSKKLVWFEHSGHEPFVDEPDKFNAAMTDLVRPAVASRPSAAAIPSQ
jgi:pimeloyl-ACP methyl ester carboxylesterase